MRQFGKLLIALSFLILSVGILAAQDEALPNDPSVNPDANACFTGGSMEGKCGDSEYLWSGAWYKIRYDYGLISRDVFPDQYTWMLPSPEEAAVNVQGWPPAGCYYSAVYSLYLIWNGNQTQTSMPMTWDGTCATPPHTGVGGFFFVSAAHPASAANLCAANGYVYIDEVSSASDTGAWPIYRCQ